MKRITLLYALAATLMVCSGCSDFLEEHNRSAVTTEGGYYDTEKGFESLINSCYTPLRFWGGKSAAMAFSETGTDILAPGGGLGRRRLRAWNMLQYMSSAILSSRITLQHFIS